jgi:hypothetical protein
MANIAVLPLFSGFVWVACCSVVVSVGLSGRKCKKAAGVPRRPGGGLAVADRYGEVTLSRRGRPGLWSMVVTPRLGMVDHEPFVGMAQAKAARARATPTTAACDVG